MLIPPEILDPQLYPLHVAFWFVFGSLWGSFFGLCVARIPAGQSIVLPNSYCFSCGQSLRWYDNLPLLSYWILRGRCRDCGTTFSIRHFMIELISGLLFAWVFIAFVPKDHLASGYVPTLPVAWVFTGLLLIATFTDLDHWIIPDSISLGGTVLGLILSAIPFPHSTSNIIYQAGPFPWGHDFWWSPLANACVGAAFGYGIMWLIGRLGTLIFRKEAMGGGDIKLFACIGAFLGFMNCVYVLFIASVLGVIFGVSMIIAARLHRRREQDQVDAAGEPSAEDLTHAALEALYPEQDVDQSPALQPQRNLLLNILTQRPPAPTLRHHLPFGPHLAMAAFLVMLYHEHIQKLVTLYLDFSSGL